MLRHQWPTRKPHIYFAKTRKTWCVRFYDRVAKRCYMYPTHSLRMAFIFAREHCRGISRRDFNPRIDSY